MKTLCVLFALAVAFAQDATLVKGVCSECRRTGRRSTVRMENPTVCTLTGCERAYYDEDGAYHPERCNTCVSSGKCSNGHRVTLTAKQ